MSKFLRFYRMYVWESGGWPRFMAKLALALLAILLLVKILVAGFWLGGIFPAIVVLVGIDDLVGAPVRSYCEYLKWLPGARRPD